MRKKIRQKTFHLPFQVTSSYERHGERNPSTARLSASIFSCLLFLCTTPLLPQVSAERVYPRLPNVTADSSQGPTQEETKPLPEFSAGEHDLKGGETQSFRINLKVGEFLTAAVEQKDIDVTVALFGPGGAKIADTDSPNDRWGPEPVLLVAEKSGEYRVNVFSPNAKASPGRYEIREVKVREATEGDKDRVAAQRAFDEGTRLSSERALASKRSAVDLMKKALNFYQSTHDKYREALALRALGLLYLQLSEFRTALQYSTNAISLAQELKDQSLQAPVETHIGGAYDVLGEPAKALEHYNRGLTLARLFSNRGTEASALNNIGKIYNDAAEWQKATEYYLQALPLFRAFGNQRTEGITLNNIGVAYNMLGDQQKALDYLQQALGLLHASGDKNAESYTLNNIGDAYRRSANYEAALKFCDQAQVIQRQTGNRPQEAETLDLIGVVYSEMGQPQKAVGYHEQALKIQRETGNVRREGISLRNLGHVYVLLGQPDQALEALSKALSLFRRIGDLNSAALALEDSAWAQRAKGNLSEARKNIEESLALIETVRVRSGSQQLRASYLASMEKAYEFYVDLLMRQDSKEPGKGHDAEALQASERGRARSLAEMLNEAHVDIRAGVNGDLVKRERELSQSLNAKAQRQIQLTAQKGSQQEIEIVNKEISALEDEYQQVQVAIRKASPAYAALTAPQPPVLKEIQTQLDQGTMLLEYSLGEERSYVWAVTQNSLKTYELPKREQIETAARRVYELLTARSQSKAGENAQTKQERIAVADSQLMDASKDLSQMVLGPIGSELGTERLVIVADGALQYVPFSALSVVGGQSSVAQRGRTNNGPRTTDNGPQTIYRPLIQDHEIISLPSASALAIQRQGLRNRKLAANSVAVMADPVFSATDERLGALAKAGVAKQAQGDSSANTRIIEHLADDSGLIIRRLKFTRQEADQILAEAPRAKNLKAIDFKANRATVTGGELSKYRYVHFATHGYIDSARPDLSAIVLSLVDEEGKPLDGFLRANEIYNLNLPAELVVLSACETGLGKDVKGEGLVGLTQGFMYAGARRVVVSLWNVNDKATAELMARFYRGMLRENKTPAAALRTAQLEMSRQKQWQSPYYWAAFVLQGEWQ
jgi:CHAT domain-containing protein